MSRKQGFTLVEILVTVLILGVLAAVAIPGFAKAKTKAEKNQAAAYLRTIRTSMRMYDGKWKSYITLTGAAAIKSSLGAEVQGVPSYTFATSGSATTYSVTATRSDSATLSLNQDGTWSGTNTPYPS